MRPKRSLEHPEVLPSAPGSDAVRIAEAQGGSEGRSRPSTAPQQSNRRPGARAPSRGQSGREAGETPLRGGIEPEGGFAP